MINQYNIALMTEYSFRKCFLPMKDIHKYAINGAVGIADLDNTFGHIPLWKESKKHGFKPIFGVRLRVSRPENERKQTGQLYTTFIAQSSEGLTNLYKLVQKAYERFYYFPRLHVSDINPCPADVMVLGENWPMNFYGEAEDRKVYQLLAGTRKQGQDEYRYQFDNRVESMRVRPVTLVDDSVASLNAEPQIAEMVKWEGSHDLIEECMTGAGDRELVLSPKYLARLEYEIDLIEKKDYIDYFMIVADLIKYAKRYMLVGPSRGSSAGSLVCYLLGITEVDPIKHELIFERFIDINRFDLPDIDVDFPDKKREMVFDYLVKCYGRDNVRALGTVNRLKPKSAIGDFAQGLGIPAYETAPVKDAIIERSSGDARAAMCVADTFDTTEPGQKFIADYPNMRLVGKVEGHAAHAGRHAAGIIVSTKPLINYAGIDVRGDVLMMDKKDAEEINLLKIDCLGLRTLSILEDTIDAISDMQYSDLYMMDLDDEETFEIFNQMRLSGVFQFEGYALQSLTRQMGIHQFSDIVAITALARPGALNSGGASRFVKYRTGVDTPVTYGDVHKRITKDTYGITVYQEQMMEIAREIGGFSWEDVSTLRKAASKSLGDEFFGKYREQFIEGALTSGLNDDDALALWNDISHSGSWSFNKSHAVSYGLISYWTAFFKAHYPSEFAVACLNNAKDSEHAIKILRDVTTTDGLTYTPFDERVSGINWKAVDDRLVGGFTNIKGVGHKKAKLYLDMREGRKAITPSFWKVMENPVTDFDILFPTDHYWGHLFHDPVSHGLGAPPSIIKDVQDPGNYVVVGCLVDRNLRDLNEYVFLKKRDGKIIEEDNLYLNLTVEDDTDSIICTINRWRFEELRGKHIAETGKVGESWYIIMGTLKGDWRKLDITAIHELGTRP